MSRRFFMYDCVVIGAGPAGIAASVKADQSELSTAVIDLLPWPGGQIWRGGSLKAQSPLARKWFHRLEQSRVSQHLNTTVYDCPEPGVILAENHEGSVEIRYQKLILALGSREVFIPFPGWTLPNVYGAGALQALVKTGWPVSGKRIAVAGSGPLLFAVAAELRAAGAKVVLIAEQSSLLKLMQFGMSLPWLSPGKLIQAVEYQGKLLGVPYLTGCYPIRANGDEVLKSVAFKRGNKIWKVPCDYLACGFGLTPMLEIPKKLGCKVEAGLVRVNDLQQTSEEDIYAAGELTGIGGVEKALIEGKIAAYGAAGLKESAEVWYLKRDRYQAFAQKLAESFKLREALKTITTSDTIICRCEDIRLGDLLTFNDWRSAKLQTRCGMGACQGRTCGTIMEILYGWENQSLRSPLFPVSLESMRFDTAYENVS